MPNNQLRSALRPVKSLMAPLYDKYELVRDKLQGPPSMSTEGPASAAMPTPPAGNDQLRSALRPVKSLTAPLYNAYEALRGPRMSTTEGPAPAAVKSGSSGMRTKMAVLMVRDAYQGVRSRSTRDDITPERGLFKAAKAFLAGKPLVPALQEQFPQLSKEAADKVARVIYKRACSDSGRGKRVKVKRANEKAAGVGKSILQGLGTAAGGALATIGANDLGQRMTNTDNYGRAIKPGPTIERTSGPIKDRHTRLYGQPDSPGHVANRRNEYIRQQLNDFAQLQGEHQTLQMEMDRLRQFSPEGRMHGAVQDSLNAPSPPDGLRLRGGSGSEPTPAAPAR